MWHHEEQQRCTLPLPAGRYVLVMGFFRETEKEHLNGTIAGWQFFRWFRRRWMEYSLSAEMREEGLPLSADLAVHHLLICPSCATLHRDKEEV